MHNKHHKPGTVPFQGEGTDKDGSVGSCLLSTVGRSGRDDLLSIANPCNLSPLNIIICTEYGVNLTYLPERRKRGQRVYISNCMQRQLIVEYVLLLSVRIESRVYRVCAGPNGHCSLFKKVLDVLQHISSLS